MPKNKQESKAQDAKAQDVQAQDGKAWALVGQLGVAIAGPIVIAVMLAVYFDAAPIPFVVIVFAGVAAGATAAYRLIAPFLN